MSERPLVTIVTPSYNQGADLEETIVSVLEQDYEPIEYAVVDGGSTDGSVEVIRRYEDRLSWWESKPDGGQAAALNDAFARSSGEVVGWLNSDDTLLPGSVSLVAGALRADPEALFAYGDAINTDAGSRRTGYFVSDDLDAVHMVRTCTDHVNPQGALFRRRALELAGPFQGFYCWDFEFVLRLGMIGHAVRIERPVATFRIHEDSKSVSSSFSRRAEDYLQMYDRFFGSPDLTPEVKAVEAEARAACLLRAGQLFYVDGDHRRARRCFLEALRLHPAVVSPRTASYLARTLLPPQVAGRLRSARMQSSP
jgi:glycosyltransferase involved in cell wall biosynthesis